MFPSFAVNKISREKIHFSEEERKTDGLNLLILYMCWGDCNTPDETFCLNWSSKVLPPRCDCWRNECMKWKTGAEIQIQRSAFSNDLTHPALRAGDLSTTPTPCSLPSSPRPPPRPPSVLSCYWACDTKIATGHTDSSGERGRHKQGSWVGK